MNTKHVGILIRGVLVGAVVVIVVAIVASEPKIAWNSGARERLSAALRAIADDLVSSRISPEDFIAHNLASQVNQRGRRSSDHGIAVKWHDEHGYAEMLFYPIAVSSAIELNTDTSPIPQIVMVPVDTSDLPTLPTFNECIKCQESELEQCQLRAIKEAFSKRRIEYAATLMSDTSVAYMRVGDVFERRVDGEEWGHP